MTLRYKSTEKCARCWQPFGAHAWGDDACPSSAGGYMRPSVFQLEKKPEPPLDEIKASLEELKKASVETIFQAAKEPLVFSSSTPKTAAIRTPGARDKQGAAVVAADRAEPKRAPLPGWDQRTPFDAFKGFEVVSRGAYKSEEDVWIKPQGPLQRFSNGDGPLGKM